MNISFRCQKCDSKIRVADKAAGRVGNCPQCGSKVQVPGQQSPDQQPPVQKSDSEQKAPAKPGRGSKPVKASSAAVSKVAPASKGASESKPNKSKRAAPQVTAAIESEDFFARLISEGDAVESAQPRRKRRRSPTTSKVKSIDQVQGKDVPEKIMDGFSGPIDPVRKTLFYRFGVLLVAGFVLILPVLYLALIGVAGWGVYWHATENLGIASYGRGRARIFAILLYAGPIFAGSIGVLFMLKPLFARSVQQGGTASLNRSGQPLLFEFVDRICETVGSPRPFRIDVNFDVNASAGYGSGVLSLVKSDLVLTIGLPLVAGMSLKAFAGVLAHEFGHFGQGAAMRVSWVVRSINHWFARVVYERDEWDEWLTEMSEDTDFRIGWVFWIARMAVGIGRGILWCFMMLSHAVTCWLARQMEFDADRYETRLSGSPQFAETCFRLHCLGFGMHDFVRNYMVNAGSDSSSPNMIRNIVRHCDELSDIDKKQIRKRIKKGKTELLATHPSDSERIAAAEKEDAQGVFDSDLPAEALFRQFDQLCSRLMTI